MNILFCSVGRRGELIKDIKDSLGDKVRVIATDLSPYAPALYLADQAYTVPRIDDQDYIGKILEICQKEKIQAVTTFIDPEIKILANQRKLFEDMGIIVLAPYQETASYCFDKYSFFKYLSNKGINTVLTYDNLADFKLGLEEGKINFPVFVKPRQGSGSVGAKKINNIQELNIVMESNPDNIIQEFMDGEDIDVDAYIDTISHEVVSMFSKKKIETKIGGASKTISFKDQRLFDFIKEACSVFKFNGPVDIDVFFRDGKYYLSEVNPRFGGAYLHAYGAGVDFFKLINNNIKGIKNESLIGNYQEGVVMMMYDSVVIKAKDDLVV